jgi:hypothetical protein
MALAVTTISLGGYNLYMGLHRIRYGSVGGHVGQIVAASPCEAAIDRDLLRHDGHGLSGLSHAVCVVPGVVARIRIRVSSFKF